MLALSIETPFGRTSPGKETLLDTLDRRKRLKQRIPTEGGYVKYDLKIGTSTSSILLQRLAGSVPVDTDPYSKTQGFRTEPVAFNTANTAMTM